MKRSTFFAVIIVFAAVLVGCNASQDPIHDTTKLWPAFNTSVNKWGFIDAKGNFAIQPMFDQVSGFSCGYAVVKMNDLAKYINTKGQIQMTTSMDRADDFYYNYATFRLNGKYGMINNKCVTVIQPMYEYIGDMGDNGLVAVRLSSSDKYGFCNAKGEYKIQPTYDDAYDFRGGGAVVAIGSKRGVIDKNGQYVIAPTYDELENMGQGLIFFEQNDRCGALDLRGNVVIQPIYDDFIALVDNNLIGVEQNEKWGYVDAKGNIKLPIQYYNVTPFFEDYAWIQATEESPYTLIDTKGKVLLTLGKDDKPYTGMHNGLALVRTEDGYKYVDVNGRVAYAWSYAYSNAPEKISAKKHGDNDMAKRTLHFSSQELY